MAKARFVAGLNEESDDDSNPITQNKASNLVQIVPIRQSSYCDAFHGHIPVRLVIDSGATENMFKTKPAPHFLVTNFTLKVQKWRSSIQTFGCYSVYGNELYFHPFTKITKSA